MIKNYFKIFYKIASQNKLFTFLSLFGISLTIMFVMIFSMAISKITSGSGPEEELENIIFAQRVKTTSKSKGYSVGSCGRPLSEKYLKGVKSAQVISMYTGALPWEFIHNGNYQKRSQNQTDAEYWDMFEYNFLDGRPYTKEEVIKGENLAVITQSLKELLFGSDEHIIGKTIHYTSMDLVVIGVVEDPPKTAQNAVGDLYFPYTLKSYVGFGDYIGGFKIAFKTGSSKQSKVIRNEAQEIISRLDASDTTVNIFLSGPYTQFEKMMVGYGDPEEYSKGTSLLKNILYIMAFLLLPAINLMALNFARIHERREEIAIRKSFGAPSAVLRRQFLFENIMMTITGGVCGIILSYIVVLILGDTLILRLNIFSSLPLTFSFSYKVFITALISCLIFGLLSGYLPAIRLSKMKPAIQLKGGEL